MSMVGQAIFIVSNHEILWTINGVCIGKPFGFSAVIPLFPDEIESKLLLHAEKQMKRTYNFNGIKFQIYFHIYVCAI